METIWKNKHLPKLWLVKIEYKMYPQGKTLLSELMAKYWGFALYSHEVLLEGLYLIRMGSNDYERSQFRLQMIQSGMTCHKANLRSQQCRNTIPYFIDSYFGEEHICYISGNAALNYAVFCHHFIILNFAVFLLITPELSEVKNCCFSLSFLSNKL